jgi:hypothetical protein
MLESGPFGKTFYCILSFGAKPPIEEVESKRLSESGGLHLSRRQSHQT